MKQWFYPLVALVCWAGATSVVGAAEPVHWAYIAPEWPELPQVTDPQWARNPIDLFVLEQLEQRGWSPAPPADPARLVRRVYLDLLGLPPTVEDVDDFLQDQRPDAYQRLVDRLLSSPRYGERWARPWLDLARYADSNGYQADQYRNVWPYRDWIIDALNSDMPFDQFTTMQLAGDLLPDAALRSRIATGFHRLTTCNVEAGVDPEENRVEQVVDRVNTTATVWLGTTLECAQCHDHKYDPFSQEDYYQLLAYFNNTPMEVEGNGVTYDFVGPKMSLPLDDERDERREQLERRCQQLEKRVEQRKAELTAAGVGEEELKEDASLKKLQRRLARGSKALEALEPPTTLVMVELDQPRETHLLARGNFLDPRDQVQPAAPAVLHDLPSGARPDRLGLARWIVDPNNPLITRVTVNRWWAEIFGRGIVTTLEDFGTQGERPTHPALLDWLALELVRSGWSTKHIHRLIVTSATYQQSSRVTPDSLKHDPGNQWYARGPRLRLPAESIRDQALVISGLLSSTMHGPPIYPPQPEGIWKHVGRNPPKYDTSQGDDRYRRGIYVIWRRSAPYPSFVNFDAPDRTSCVVSRPRTNTALQALTLLNDPAYVELTWGFAERLASTQEQTPRQRIAYAIRCCVAREPQPAEVAHLMEVYEREVERLRQDTEATKELLAQCQLPPEGDPAQWGAWFYIASILLNLDETITK